MKLTLLLFTILLARNSLARDICYGELGCYTTDYPFSGSLARPIGVLPDTPAKIDTRFYLYTRSNVYPSTVAYDVDSAYFQATKNIKFIVHGLLHNAFKKWAIDMKDALLRAEDCNVIIVDWSSGNQFPYTQATANTQVVGAEIARFIKYYVQRNNINVENVHIIGHSLGAHIAGYAGARTQNLGRITGLDPAGPYFENTDTVVRLDKTDAKFVDVIHTDGASTLQLGLGLMQMSGHVDFYANGGKQQPNCPPTSIKLLSAIFNLATQNLENLEDGALCNHMASINYFTDSIENPDCKYTAFPCNSEDDFNSGKCITCSANGCNRMGYKASAGSENGMLFFNTQNGMLFPYCRHEFLVRLNSNNLVGQTQARGTFSVVFTGDRTSSLPLLLDNADVTFKTGSSEVRFINSGKFVGEVISEIKVYYTKTTNFLSSFLYQNEWSFKSVEIVYADYQKIFKFCPTTNYITSGSFARFVRC